MENKYNFNLFTITKYYLFFVVTLMNIFSTSCSGVICEKKIISETNRCVEKCPKDTYELGDYCYYQCPAHKNMKNDYTKLHKSCKCKENYYLYKKETNGKEEYECVEICPTQFYDYESKKCVNDCGNKLTHIDRDNMGNEKQKRCSKKCLPLEFLKKEENACLDTCDYYLKEKDTKICVEKYEDGYIYNKTQIRKLEDTQCSTYYKKENEKKICMTREECIADTSLMYIKGYECTNTCDGYIILNDLGSKSGCYEYKTDCIKKNYTMIVSYNNNSKICKMECDEGFFQILNYYSNSVHYCSSDCPSDYPYKDESNKVCVQKCEKYYESNSCADQCTGKYRFNDSKICVDNCTKDKNTFYIMGEKKEDDENICHYSCIGNYKYISNYETANKEAYICVESCGEKYYYEDKKICLDSCDLHESESSKICVYRCKDNEIVFTKNINNNNFYYCGSTCNKFIEKQNISSSLPLMEVCVTECNTAQYPLKSNSTKYCLKECPLNESYIYNYECFDKCPDGTYVDELDKKCMDNKCPNNTRLFYEKIDNIYICREKCPGGRFIEFKENSQTEGECVKVCSEGKNYIINKNTCVAGNDNKCPNDLYPIKIDTATSTSTSYSIYNCSENCGDKYTIYNEKKCVDQCGSGYYESPDKICYKDNCKLNKDYPFTTINSDGKNICAKKCNDTQPFYDINEKICKTSCDAGKIYDFDNQCVDKCEKSIYIYHDETEDGKKKCVAKCPESKKYYDVGTNHTCVKICPKDYNYVKENKCVNESQFSCNENQFTKTNEVTEEVECVLKCNDTQFYYEDKRICIPNCINENHFKIQGTQICISDEECPSPYNSYYKDDGNKGSYDSNMCVLKCPTEKPYIDNRKCVTNCPQSGNKYHLYGDINCMSQCPAGTVINDTTCTSVCPGNRFLDHLGEKCIDKCDSSYPYYVEGVNQCIKNCPKGYLYEGNKCVTSCNETNYKVDEYCKESCEEEKNFVLDKVCLDKCPDDFPIFKTDETKNIKICLKECSDHLYPDGECKGQCNETFPFYNYENGTCLKECPYFYLEKNCYKQCPSTHSYYIKSSLNHIECLTSCNSSSYFINITNNICQGECQFKEFVDGDKKYCLNDCDELGLLTNGNQCIKTCGENYIFNAEKSTCECQNLYYYDEQGKKTCLPLNTNECPTQYKIRKNGEKECLKNCKGHILSNDESICYFDDINTFKCPLVSQSVKSYSDKEIAEYKCDCPAKFYKEKNSDNKEIKVCLSEHEECPSEYKYYKPDKNECVPESDCKEADNYCKIETVNLCLLKNNDDNCNELKWNKDENTYTPVKITECNNNEKYYEMEGTNICLKNCQNTTNFIFHDNKCISSCNNVAHSELYKIPSSSLGENPLSLYKCRCTNLWYKDSTANDKITCLDPEINECNIDGKTKKIVDTNECVENCDLEFNDGECFASCYEVKKYYPGNEYKQDGNKCRCVGLWAKNENNKIECIKGSICPEEKKYLIFATNECTSELCSKKRFNNICYEDNCPSDYNVNGDECICKYKWYKYDNEFLGFNDYKVCLGENEPCPDEYPYNHPDGECLKSLDGCPKIFNNECVRECEGQTKVDPNNEQMCICNTENSDNPENVKWYQYTLNGKAYLKCGEKTCPENKKYFDEATKECLVSCNANKYIYENTCYDSCPGKTKVLDQISKICEDILIFDNEEEMKSLDDLKAKIEDKTVIKDLYQKKSSVGLVYNIDNSTMQFYGVSNKKETNQDLLMRSNLTFIDISKCLDKLYKKYLSGPDEDGEIIILKYDIGDATNSTTINPVEYQLINSKTGEKIPMDVCEDNSILISYPLSSILNNFPTRSKKSRKLQESDEEMSLDLNFKERFLLGKELYLQDNEIDIFNYENKIYNDMCYPFEINGKNLILEDRFNYLYPLFTFCESNCKYNNTDYILERINCYCSPKDQIQLDRTFVYQKSEADIEKIKDNQKSTIFKCLSKISNLSKNFGFFYGLIIFMIEMGMILLTVLYSYKIFDIRVKRKFDINGDDKYSINDDIDNGKDSENNEITENNVEIGDKKKKKKINNGPIKTTERNLMKNPPKKTVFTNEKKNINKRNNKDIKKKVDSDKKGNAKNVINIKKMDKNKDFEEKISSSNYPDMAYEKNSLETMKDMDEESLFTLIKLEEKLLRVDYEVALRKNKAEVLVIIITEIMDKIYLLKSTWLLQKYEIFSLHFSLYALWHMLMLSFLCLFYNNSMLHKIWTTENYPDLGYYLAFGLVVSIIVFIIYKGCTFLLNNDIKIKEIEMAQRSNTNEITQKYSKMIKCSKIKLAIYYVLQFSLLIVFFLYLMVFCYLYSATQSNLVESYLIALIEVVIIKVVYGLILGILRKISLAYELNKLYTVVRFLDLYIA